MKDDAGDPSPRVISSESEKSFSLTVKGCMRVNGNGKPVSPGHWGLRCFIRRKKAIWEMILIHSFLFRYVSEPPPLRAPSSRGEGY